MHKNHYERRKILKAGLGLSIMAAVAPGSLRAASSEGSALRIATYGGNWRDNVEKYICAELIKAGTKLEFVVGNPNANLAKLIAAHRQKTTPFDAMDGSPLFYPQLAKANMLEKLDYSLLPSAKGMPEWSLGEFNIEPNWTTDCVVYNAAKFKEAGIPVPSKYTDLLNPKLKGKVAYPDPAHVQHWCATVAIAYEEGGSERNLEPAVAVIKKMAPAYFFTSSVDLAAKFGAGDIWAAPWGASWALRLRESIPDISVAYMQIGDKVGALWPGTRMIVRNPQNRAAAHAYLDAYFAENSAYGFCMATGNVPANGAARSKMAEDPLCKEMLLLTDAALDKAFRVKWSDIDDRKWREIWNRGVHA